jgi:glycosyltransferase involved in cell wall biosynthesis
MSQKQAKKIRKQVKDRRLRILWSSNAVWANSGYSVETRDVLYRLLKDGWPIAEIGFAGLGGSPIGVNGLQVYPTMQDVWGSDALVSHGKHWRANVVFTMQDIPLLQPQFLSEMINMKLPWIPWVPIDQEPVPPAVLDRLKYAYKIITFSKFGQKAIQKKGFYSKLILEGTDTNIFQPRSKEEARRKMGWPQDKFIFGMIGANKENPPRKGWQEGLEAFAMFNKNHPDSLLYIHSNQWFPTGFPIHEYANHLGIGNKIFQLDQYLVAYHTNSTDMAMAMNGLDCLLQPSMTEGFGLPIIEAGASGIPVVINDCTAMPELVIEGVTGEKCKSGKKIFSSQGGFIYFADADSLHEKMETVFKNTPDFYKDAARQHVLNNYDIDKLVVNEWIPYLENLQEELLGPNLLTNKINNSNLIVTNK